MNGRFSDVAIAGVGYTAFSKCFDGSVGDLAVAAVDDALLDCGLDRDAIDGLASYHINDSIEPGELARSLNIDPPRWLHSRFGGGSQGCTLLGVIAEAIAQQQAETVVLYRAMKGRSGKRMGQLSIDDEDNIDAQFFLPYGSLGPVNTFALSAQRWLRLNDYHAEQLASVVISQRNYAAGNPRAMQRSAITPQDYLDAPMISSPLRRLDCCLETDGACALVITTRERARQLAKPGVAIRAALRGGDERGRFDKAPALEQLYSAELAEPFYQLAGIDASAIDIAYPYDAYSFLIPVQLADFGFCDAAASIDFIAAGETGPDGTLPTNTHGGLLSEGYIHGLNSIAEAVLQLRNQQQSRQVKLDRGLALCTGFGGRFGSAALLEADG